VLISVPKAAQQLPRVDLESRRQADNVDETDVAPAPLSSTPLKPANVESGEFKQTP
jgi:hypothetical protein